jgi:hypothetical protein
MAISKDTRIRIIELGVAALAGGGVVFATLEARQAMHSREGQPAFPADVATKESPPVDQVDEEHATEGLPVAGERDDSPADRANGELAETTLHAPPIEPDAAGLARYPNTGVIAAGLATVRERPTLDAARIGMIRGGTRIRVSEPRPGGDGCKYRWYEVFPKGWACLSNDALRLGQSELAPDAMPVLPLHEDQPVPVEVWRVTHNLTPIFHRLPTHREQEQADVLGRAWAAEHGNAVIPMEGPDRPPDVPNFVREYANAGYWVTASGDYEKNGRTFRKTSNGGAYIRKAATEQRESSNFSGLALSRGEQDLPIYWILRELPLKTANDAGELIDSPERLERRSRHPFIERVRVGDYEYYRDAEGKMMRAYAVGVAALMRRPPGVAASEHWIHVDLSEQVLVAYDGDRPVFTTLVSTGKEPGMTPVGIFRIQSKHVVTAMRDQPMESDAYSIDDVPWTQYFSNSVALHGAFWHGGFGLVRSHGCVNLSPRDARWLFGFTHPVLPADYVSVFADVADHGRGSAVVITE